MVLAAGESRPWPPRLGRYEIMGVIARGGMAEVLLGRRTGLEGFEKLVAVKRILPALAIDRELISMFLDEARIAATLHHDNIVQVHDVGAHDGEHFLAMELLHGANLRDVLKATWQRGEGLPLGHSVHIALGMCAGLHHAHERRSPDGTPLGIVHRDVSPQNIFITREGGVKLLDFGIVKASHRSSETRTGTIKGKLGYMSPEQLRPSEEEVDRRSDVFSAAVVLWEMTVGRWLFRGDDYDVMKRIIEEGAPPPSRESPDYPPALERIVMRGLACDKADRYQSAQQMLADLERFAGAEHLALSPFALGRFVTDRIPEEAAAGEGQDGADDGQRATRPCSDPSAPGLSDWITLEVGSRAKVDTSAETLPASAGPPRLRRLLLVGLLAAAAAIAWFFLSPTSSPPPSASSSPSAAPAPAAAPAPSAAPAPAPAATAAPAPAATAAPAPEPPASPSPSPRSRSSSTRRARPSHRRRSSAPSQPAASSPPATSRPPGSTADAPFPP